MVYDPESDRVLALGGTTLYAIDAGLNVVDQIELPAAPAASIALR